MKITNSQKLVDLFLIAEKGLNQIISSRGFEYPEEIQNFVHEIAQSDWLDYNYNAGRELQKFRNSDYMQKASEAEICSILTAFSRGERFCDGFISSSFRKGYIRNTMERLAKMHHIENI